MLTYVYHGDARTAFVQQPDGKYTNATVPAFRGARITLNSDGTRTLRDKDGRSVIFALAPSNVALPSALTDANGNRLMITRDGSWRRRRHRRGLARPAGVSTGWYPLAQFSLEWLARDGHKTPSGGERPCSLLPG